MIFEGVRTPGPPSGSALTCYLDFPLSRRWVVFFSFILILIDHDSVSKQWRQATPRADPEGG